MGLILASDFPSTTMTAVNERINGAAAAPRIAWISAVTDQASERFNLARQRFAVAGFDQLEHLDIDEALDQVQMAYLHEFDVVYLSDDDPVRFRYNAIRAGLAGRLRQCATLGRLIIGAGAGAMLLTPNVSIFRLRAEPVDQVLSTRGRFDTLGVVSYELLPHAQLADPILLDKVRNYSEQAGVDVVAMADGSAIFPTTADAFEHVGAITRYHRGEIIATEPHLE